MTEAMQLMKSQRDYLNELMNKFEDDVKSIINVVV